MRNMITLLRNLIFVTVLCTVTLSQTIAVQGILRDPSGKTAQDGNYTLTFRLYNSDTGGGNLWTETHPSVPVKHGVYAVELGTITNFDNLTFSEQYYIGVTVGAGNELIPRVKLTTSPTSMAVFGKDNIFPSSGKVGVGTITPTALLHIEQTDTNDTTDLLIIDNGTKSIEVSSDGVMHIPSSIQFNDGSILSTAQGSSASSLSSSGDAIIATDNDEDGTGDILLRTGPNTQMVVKNDGKVGIGTTTPSANLEVEGETIFNGNVGIGLTSPNYKLDVEGHTGLNGILYMNANEAAGIFAPNAYLDLRSNHDLYGVIIRNNIEYSNSQWGNIEVNDGNLGFSYQSPTPHMAIAAGGNVGIGTTSPSYPLDIFSNSNNLANILKLNGGNNTQTSLSIRNITSLNSNGWWLFDPGPNSEIKFGTSSGSTTIDRVTIEGDLLTAGEAQFLENGGSLTFDGNGWTGHLKIDDEGMKLGGNSSTRDIQFQTNNSTRMTVAQNGLVGIGTTSPERRFHVYGTEDLSLADASGFVVFGDINAYNIGIDNNEIMARNNGNTNTLWLNAAGGSVDLPSDRRLKRDITPFDNVLNKVLNLNPVSYEWKNNAIENKNRNFGFIAQDFMKYFPEIVTLPKTGENEYYSMQYGGIGVIAIKAIQEQQEIIETQANEIEDLKARLARIEAKLK